MCNLCNKKKCVIKVKALKQTLDHELILEKVHRVIKFYQESWLILYTYMNTEPRTRANNNFENDFSKLIKNSVFGKTRNIVKKHRDIKNVATDKRRSHLVSKPNYHTTK